MSGVYWQSAAPDLLHASLTQTLLDLEFNRDQEYAKYADYYDGRPEVIVPYFKKRHREQAERFQDRPKLSWPICRPISDAHATALAKEVKIEIDHPKTQEWWNELAEHNNMPAFLSFVSSIVSVYGSAGAKPLVVENDTPDGQIEFEAFPPDTMKFVYERNSQGRSVKRFIGAGVLTGYSIANGTVFDWDTGHSEREKYNVKQRAEYISPTRWLVWLDGKITPESPFGERWMPTDDGANPFGTHMAVLFNGLETHESFLGASDLHLSIYDVQAVNEIWSDLIYMLRMYVPIQYLKTDSEGSRKQFKAGIGAGVMLNTGEELDYAQGSVDWTGVMEPLKIALEITYSNAKVPSVAVGLGHLFGGQSVISGVAKEYEWKPTVSHAEAKQAPFARGVRDLVRVAMKIAKNPKPFGQANASIDENASIKVTFPADIMPVSQMERLEQISKEQLSGLLALFTAMKKYHKWDDARAAREMDIKKAESRQNLVEAGFGKIVEAAEKREKITLTAQDEKALFRAARVPVYDGGEKTDEDASGESPKDTTDDDDGDKKPVPKNFQKAK